MFSYEFGTAFCTLDNLDLTTANLVDMPIEPCRFGTARRNRYDQMAILSFPPHFRNQGGAISGFFDQNSIWLIPPFAGDCSRLRDFELAVALADTNDLGKLVKQIGLETPHAFWAPARVSADAWLELMGYRRSLVTDRTVLLIGHGFHHKLARQSVSRGSRMNGYDYLGCEAALSIAVLGSR
jgi:hypothetical protein